MSDAKMKKVMIIRLISIFVVPVFVMVVFLFWALIISNLDAITPSNDTYYTKRDIPLLLEVDLDYDDDRHIQSTILEKSDHSFKLVYKNNDVVICTAIVSIPETAGIIEYESSSNEFIGKLHHSGVETITFQFDLSDCQLDEVSIYVQNSYRLTDLTFEFGTLFVFYLFIIFINIISRQRFIKTLDVEKFKATKIRIAEKIGFMIIGSFSPVIAAILFIILGADTKDYKNIKRGEIAMLTSIVLITIMIPVIWLTLYYIE